MNYISLGLFCIWVLIEVLSAEEVGNPRVIPATKQEATFADRPVEAALFRDTFVHNIGAGPVLEKSLPQWEVVGHYRYHSGTN